METLTKVKQIVIKPVVKSKFAGLSSYSNTRTSLEGAQLGSSGYKTGLSKKEEQEFEEALSLKKGELAKSNGTFWGSVLNISFPNDKAYYMTIDPDNVMDVIKYKVLLNHSRVANNEVEMLSNPMVEFYIEDNEAKAKIEEVQINYKMEAGEEFSKLTGEDKKGILKLYGKKGVNDLSDLVIKTKLYKEMETNPNKFLQLVRDKDIKLRIEIEEMLEAGVLSKKGQYYVFNNSTNLGEPEVIGSSIDEVVGYFKDYKNQSIKIAAKVATKDKQKEN